MSRWDDFDFEERLREILRTTPIHAPEHHLGRPFLTSYQLAIAFAERYPTDAAQIGLPIGGAGTGAHNSLAQYIGGELSRRINSGQLRHIEGAFLSDFRLMKLSFRHEGDQIASSLIGTWDTAMFRLVD
jgi:hypothetical protein